MKIYKDIDRLPAGAASNKLTEGNLVLEGGGWKGLYTLGVLDCMMKHDVNLTTVTGVSAGAVTSSAKEGTELSSIASVSSRTRNRFIMMPPD